MATRNRKTPPKKGGSKKSSSSSAVIWVVLITLTALGAWLYFNPTEEPRKKVVKESTEKRALEMLKDHPSAEVFDVQEDGAKKKSSRNLP